jgi:TusA-related sulfurtransferase
MNEMNEKNIFHTQQKDDEGHLFAIQLHLDVRGLTCPQPALRTLEQSQRLNKGEVLEVVGDWPGSKLEVPFAVADRDGLEILRIIESEAEEQTEPDDDVNAPWWIYIIRRSQ